jgi:hypothetical protein
VRNTYNNIKNTFWGLLAILAVLTACEAEEDLPAAARIFRPVVKGEMLAPANYINVAWQPVKEAVSYKVQISQDTFRTILSTMVVDTNATTFENLQWDKLYQIQVRSNAADSTKNSRMSILGSVKTPKFPTILKVPTLNDVTDEAIKVSWTTSGAPVTSIKVLKAADKTLVREVTLAAQDVTNQYRIINRLTGATGYLIELYSGTALRGYETYTTKVPLAGNLIDLRDITGKPSALADTILDAPAGSTIILKRGETYDISAAINLNKAVTILSGADLMEPKLAVIFFTSNFNFAAGSVIDYIDFKEVVLRSDSYGSRYIFNTTSAATVGRISFESCHAEIFRGMVRLQSGATTVDNFVVNNSVLDSLSGYGVLTVDNVACKVNNISIRNSTLYKVEKVITSRQNSASVLIENCTVNEGPWGGNYLVDYSTSGTNNVTGGIKIRNNIFGIGKSNAGNRAVRGYRAGSDTSADVNNTFTTSDHVVVSNPFPGVIPYAKTSFDLFENPKNGNFRIKDSGFAGKNNAGDPRWRP